jgi:hypothetical protein
MELIGIPQTTPIKPAANKDPDVRYPLRSSRIPRIVDRTRQKQEWTLLHIQSAKDGYLRCSRQRAVGTYPYLHSAEGLCWKDKCKGQDPSDPHKQLDCKLALTLQ